MVKDNDRFDFPEKFFIDRYLWTNKEKVVQIENKLKSEINAQDFTKFDIEIEALNNVGYNLKGIAIHSGGSDGGHYYTYIKIKGKWYKFNDSSVTQVSLQEAFEDALSENQDSSNAASLFYTRIEDQPEEDFFDESKLKKLI